MLCLFVKMNETSIILKFKRNAVNGKLPFQSMPNTKKIWEIFFPFSKKIMAFYVWSNYRKWNRPSIWPKINTVAFDPWVCRFGNSFGIDSASQSSMEMFPNIGFVLVSYVDENRKKILLWNSNENEPVVKFQFAHFQMEFTIQTIRKHATNSFGIYVHKVYSIRKETFVILFRYDNTHNCSLPMSTVDCRMSSAMEIKLMRKRSNFFLLLSICLLTQ